MTPLAESRTGRRSDVMHVLAVPHFIGIGAARAGTTWVSENLQRHPRIWIPRRKELHYFTRGRQYPSPSFLADASPVRRLCGWEPRNVTYKRNLMRAFGHDALHPSWSQFVWDCRYYFGRVSDEWYGSLFRAQADKVTGEITPAYSLLSEEDARRLIDLLPGVKIIHLMRHPCERAWSTIRYHEKRYGKRLTAGSAMSITGYLANPAIVLRSNYPKVLGMWRRLLPAGRLFVGFYDEIVEQPAELLMRLFRFLGVPDGAESFDRSKLRAQVNPSFEKSMPSDVRVFLAKQYLREVEELNEMVGGYAGRWLEDMRATLAERVTA